jgi:hypothetical protein
VIGPVSWWLAHGADALPYLGGVCVVVGLVVVLSAVALRLLTRVLLYAGLISGGGWLLTKLKWFRPRKRADFYRTYLGSAAWKAQAAAARARAGHRCSRCKRAGPLDVHHLHYRNLGHEQPTDVVALCRKCHQAEHRRTGTGGQTRRKGTRRW